MIRYDLKCARGHAFDAWFRGSQGYEDQRAAKAITCPVCGNSEIDKTLMAPSIARPARPEPATPSSAPALMAPPNSELAAALTALRQKIETEATYVGRRFPEEARRQHLEETEAAPIWGEATAEEARELLSEGVPIAPLPPLPRRDD